jgi:membrane protease YdiL (CAAX protease family)
MPPGSPEQAAALAVLGYGMGVLLAADLALLAVLFGGWMRGRSLLARRWSAAHVLVAFQAWLVPTLLVAGAGTAAMAMRAPHVISGDLSWLRPVLLSALVVQNVAMVAVVLHMVLVVYDQLPAAVGLSLRGWGPKAALGVVSAAVVIPLSVGLERLSAQAISHSTLPGLVQRGFDAQMTQVLGMFSGPGGFLLALLLIGIIGPLGEEVFFRGFAYRCFRARWGRTVGVLASAALFSLIHVHPLGLLSIFVVGCALAYLYERTGTLVAPFALHAANNVAALIALQFGQGR